MISFRKMLRTVRQLFGPAAPKSEGGAAPAPTYTWKAAAGGHWDDPANWDRPADEFPEAGEFVKLAKEP